MASPEGEYSGPLPPPGPRWRCWGPREEWRNTRGPPSHSPQRRSKTSPAWLSLCPCWRRAGLRSSSADPQVWHTANIQRPCPGPYYHPLALNYDTFVQALKLNHNHFIPRAFERRMSALAAPQGMPCHFQRFIIVWLTPAVPTGPIFLRFSPPSASKWRIAREHFFFLCINCDVSLSASLLEEQHVTRCFFNAVPEDFTALLLWFCSFLCLSVTFCVFLFLFLCFIFLLCIFL